MPGDAAAYSCFTSKLRNVKKVGCRNPRQASLRQRKKILWGAGRPQKHSLTPLSDSWWGRATFGSCHTPLLPFSSPRHPSPVPFSCRHMQQNPAKVGPSTRSAKLHLLAGQKVRQAGRQALRGMTQWFPPCQSLPALPPSYLSSPTLPLLPSSPPPSQAVPPSLYTPSSFWRWSPIPPPSRTTFQFHFSISDPSTFLFKKTDVKQ